MVFSLFTVPFVAHCSYLYLSLRIVICRFKELIIPAGGHNIAPVPIEDNVKKECPAISNIMMVTPMIRIRWGGMSPSSFLTLNPKP